MTTSTPKNRAEVLDMLSQLVAFDTTSRNSNLALIDYVEDYLSKIGARCTRIMDDTGTKANLLASIGPDVPGGVVVSGHSDVVPVDGQDWHTDPFTLTHTKDRVYGRGTTDMKGFVAVCLALAPRAADLPLKRPLHIAISHDEEVGCVGVRSLIDHLKDHPIAPSAVLIGEPTSMGVVDAHKGILSYKVTITGREAHSSTRGLGLSAISIATRLIQGLSDLGESFADGSHPHALWDERFTVPHATISVGTIEGGTAVNIIPKDCSFIWECRPLPQEDPTSLLQPFFDLVDAIRAEMQAHVPEADIVVENQTTSPGLSPEPGSAAEQLAFRLAQQNHTTAVAFATEGGLFQSIALPTVVCGPGHIDQAHTANEFIELAQLDAAADMINGLLDELTSA